MEFIITLLRCSKAEGKKEQKCCCENVDFHDGLEFLCVDSSVVVIG